VPGFSGEEDKKGVLARGRLADLAVLSADYFTVPENEIAHLESVLTVTGGRIVNACGPYKRLDPPQVPVNPTWSPAADDRFRPRWGNAGPAGTKHATCGCTGP
jgi:hypothetical protein